MLAAWRHRRRPYIDFNPVLLSLFASYPPSSLNGEISSDQIMIDNREKRRKLWRVPIRCRKVSWTLVHKRLSMRWIELTSCRKNWDLPSRKIGLKLCTFSRLFPMTSRVNGKYVQKQNVLTGEKRWKPQKSHIVLKISWTLVHKRLKTTPSYLPTFRKRCMLFLCQPSRRQVTEQNSTKLCNMLGSEPDLQMNIKSLRASPKIAELKLLILGRFWTRQNYFICWK